MGHMLGSYSKKQWFKSAEVGVGHILQYSEEDGINLFTLICREKPMQQIQEEACRFRSKALKPSTYCWDKKSFSLDLMYFPGLSSS